MPRKKRVYETTASAAYGVFGFGPSPTPVEVDRWVFPDRLTAVKKSPRELVLCMDANGIKLDFSLTLPALGGVRLRLGQGGFFNPEETAEIVAGGGADGETAFSTADGARVRVTDANGRWAVEIADASARAQLRFDADSFAFGYRNGTLEKVKWTFPIAENEKLFGCGERFGGLDQAGERQLFWNTDCGYHGNSEKMELWRSYKNIPLLHSSRGHSVFFSSYYPAVSDLGFADEARGFWEFWGPTFDLFVWTGAMRDTIRRYTDLTGKTVLPPRWAFHYMSGGGNGFWYGPKWGENNNPKEYLALLRSVLEGYDRLGTPHVAALYGEGYLADNDRSYELLNAAGTRMLCWNPPDYSKSRMQGLLPGVPEDELPRLKDVRDPSREAGNYIDFFNPHTKDMLINCYRHRYEIGLRGGMLDFAEMVPDYALYSNGMTGREMHNFNPYWYGKLYGEAAREILGEDYLYYCRGGCAGSQRWCANFSGDQAATFFGLRQQMMSGLSLGFCGVSAWGADLAGYEGKPEPEVFIRGMQFATFQPLMRAHGTRTRCPWDFGEEAEAVYRRYYWLRENLVDKLYGSAIAAHRTGLPMMQAMALAFPGSGALEGVESQYLFCEDLLVAPVLESGVAAVEVHFPPGSWYALWDGTRETGERTSSVPVTLEDCPVYLRAGSVIPAEVSENLRLAEPMDDGNSARALLLTPPDSRRETRFWTSPEAGVDFISEPLGDGAFRVRSSEPFAVSALLVYGVVKELRIDGAPAESPGIGRESAAVSRVKLTGKPVQTVEVRLA